MTRYQKSGRSHDAVQYQRRLHASGTRRDAQQSQRQSSRSCFPIGRGCRRKVVEMYGTVRNGPGAMLIIDVSDPQAASIISGVIKSSGAVENVQMNRLLVMDEIVQIRTKAAEIAGSYKSPGQQ